MAFDIKDLINNPDFYNYVLPFLLIFTLTFAILQKVKLFGKEDDANKKYNAIVALVLGFLVIRNQHIIGLIQRFLPNISFFIIVILMFIVLMGLFLPKEYRGFEKTLFGLMVVISLGLTFWALASDKLDFEAPYWLQDWYYSMDPVDWVWLLVIVFFLWFVFGKEDKNIIKDTLDFIDKGIRK